MLAARCSESSHNFQTRERMKEQKIMGEGRERKAEAPSLFHCEEKGEGK